jgi:predicted dehydrogenase
MEPFKVGVIGCGNISDIYFEAPRKFAALKTVACADLDWSRAEAKAKKHGIRRILTVDELLSDDEIDVVLNLTVPSAHYPICESALQAGKHVYVEKPLSVSRDQGDRLLVSAADRGVRVGCAPDTFLGAGIQTCRKLIDDGAIGVPVAASGFMLSHGPERWHLDPAFFYKPGAGPLFDMGPYYLTAMVALLGPIANVTATTRISFREREIGTGPKKGDKILVETPTHVAGVLEFASGVVGTLTTSFDVWFAEVPRIEIYGAEGTLSVPDPNTFGGPVRLRLKNETEWRDIPLSHEYAENSRGIGIAEMGIAIAAGRPHRASGALANHVLEAMHGLLQAAEERRHYSMTTTVIKPASLPSGWPETGG